MSVTPRLVWAETRRSRMPVRTGRESGSRPRRRLARDFHSLGMLPAGGREERQTDEHDDEERESEARRNRSLPFKGRWNKVGMITQPEHERANLRIEGFCTKIRTWRD
ncbi:hypothetical protein CIRG_05402 [Coccidioides immitis RMSCC 2394]|uniref:Uncharacterized protein n=3 Tax=Coccidioides TaxID=5500 RepID=E9D7I5_COCPS|nr:conserved hypothetical protein [Coccidioides posadasii str. Silveira]KMM71013.1 hypothetical protein CPAG_07320 [Coccidioides posadasii RMSCC 3488]KMP05721.1 hypothetical protein CIRG_05402 [Coccidioides immitis RMSCC 2394]